MISHSQTITKLMGAMLRVQGLVQPGQFWFGHPDYPGYLIGAHGAVVSFARSQPRLLSAHSNGAGYPAVTMRTPSGFRSRLLHRLVAEVVHGPAPDGHECRHLDGRKANADFTNLRWGTARENTEDKRAHGAIARGERIATSKLTAEDVRAMRAMRAAGATFKTISERYGISLPGARFAVVGRTWGHVS